MATVAHGAAETTEDEKQNSTEDAKQETKISPDLGGRYNALFGLLHRCRTADWSLENGGDNKQTIPNFEIAVCSSC